MDRRPLPQVFLGVLVIALGVTLLLNQLGLVDVNVGQIIGDWWPVAIIAVGFAALLAVPRAWFGPVVIMLVGGFFLLGTLDVVEVNFWELLWPVVIILVGISLVTRLGTRGSDDEVVNSAVVWWGSQRRSTSQRFRGGSLSAVMGGIEVDLRQADIEDKAELAIFVLWGGVEVKVPPTWRVRVTGLPILGGWDDKTTAPADPSAPELVVHVTAVMGGAEIKN